MFSMQFMSFVSLADFIYDIEISYRTLLRGFSKLCDQCDQIEKEPQRELIYAELFGLYSDRLHRLGRCVNKLRDELNSYLDIQYGIEKI